MSTTTTTTNCFSGQCGLCKLCCQPLYIEKEVNHSKEFMDRGKDFIKFLSRESLYEYDKDYIKKLKGIIKRTDYVSPEDHGFLSDKKKINDEVYHLKKVRHKLLCDNAMCRVRFLNTHEYLREKNFCKLPIYTNDKNKFCVVCIERTQDHRRDIFL